MSISKDTCTLFIITFGRYRRAAQRFCNCSESSAIEKRRTLELQVVERTESLTSSQLSKYQIGLILFPSLDRTFVRVPETTSPKNCPLQQRSGLSLLAFDGASRF